MSDPILNPEALEAAEPWMIINAMKQAVSALEKAINKDLALLVGAIYLNGGRNKDEAFYAEATKELARIAASNRSTWSGGHSLTNLQEQMTRDEALSMIGRLWMISNLDDLADEVEEARK